MLDDYKECQNIAYQILVNSVKKNKVSHAYLIELNDSYLGLDFAYAISKFLLCPNNYTNNNKCENCNQCNVIDQNNYLELKVLKPDGKNIKKNQIFDLQNEFKNKSIIGKNKIYILEEAEKLNEEAANALLKFLEEPYEGIIAILLTKNSNQLYNTIKSRCQVIKLKDKKIKTDESTIKKISDYIFLSEEDKKEFIENEPKEKIDFIVDYLEYLETNGLKTIIFKNKSVNKFVDEVLNLDRFFKVTTLFYKDILNVVLGKNIEVFSDYKEKIEKLSLNNTKEQIASKLNIIIEISNKIKYNINVNLLMDKFVALMAEV